MNLGRAFTYATDDPGWQNKVVYTLVIGIIPIVNLAVLGWAIDLIRNMLDDVEHPMPDWNDLGNQFTERWITGLVVAIAAFVYNIPILVINGIFGGIFGLLFSGTEGFGFFTLSLALSCCQGLIGAIYAAVIWLPLTTAVSRYARTRDFNEFLQIGQNLQSALEHFSTLILLVIFVFVYFFALTIVGLIPCIGWLLVLVSVGLSAIVLGHLMGQAALIITGQAKPHAG